jgi:phenylacetate-CoA ligase
MPSAPSAIPGIAWPPLSGIGAGHRASNLKLLSELEWLSPAALREGQFRQLDVLLRHAARHSPYYAERLAGCGWTAADEIGAFPLARLPILTRAALQDHGPELLCGWVPPEHGQHYQSSSSGSTGRRVTVTKTAVISDLFDLLTLRNALWQRRDLRGRIAVIRYLHDPDIARNPQGAVEDNWGSPFAEHFRTGGLAMLDIRHDVRLQAEWLLRQNPDYLMTFPSNLHALADLFLEQGWSLPRLTEIQTLSEVMSPSIRALAQQAWGARVTDIYSAQEVGYIALQAPDAAHYLVQSETMIVEVLDDQGRACGPGETGRIVITQLHNFATPIIRYDIGDLGEVGHPCPSGRGLPVINGIGGRVRNLVCTPDGRKYWPAVPLDVFKHVAPVRQFQLIQKSLTLIEARMAVARPLTAAEEAQVLDLVREELGYPFEVSFTYLDELRRNPANGKFEDFRSELLG